MFKVHVPFPTEADMALILERTTGADRPAASVAAGAADILAMQRLARAVPIAPHVTAYAVALLAATHPDQPRAPEIVREYVRYGGSPRGAQALVLAGKISALLDGRFNVAVDDVRSVALPALRHRIIRNFEGEAEGITTDAIVRAVLDAVPAPTVD
jgi:MoxR-like ATPase